MSPLVIQIAWTAVILLLYIAILGALVRSYRSTRNVGIIWLGVAVVLWPALSELVYRTGFVLMHRAYRLHLASSWRSFLNYFGMLQRIIELVLLLVAVLYLTRRESNPAPER